VVSNRSEIVQFASLKVIATRLAQKPTRNTHPEMSMMKLSQQVLSKEEPKLRKQKRVPFYLSQTAREKARKLFVNSIQICGQILCTAVNSGSPQR
jgi:hypothetical protein